MRVRVFKDSTKGFEQVKRPLMGQWELRIKDTHPWYNKRIAGQANG